MYSPLSFFGYLFYIEDEHLNLTSLAINPTLWEGLLNHFSYFFVNHTKNYELKTFEWWTEAACNQLQLVTLNSFDKKTSKWRQSLKIQEKFLNFHGCNLTSVSHIFLSNIAFVVRHAGIFEYPPWFPFVFYLMESYEMKVINIFAERGNLTVHRPPLESRILPDDEHDLLDEYGGENFYFYQIVFHHRYNDHYCSTPFIDQDLTAVYSPPEPYTNYEKMVLPFDFDTWLYLMITFAAAFFIIFIINFLPNDIKDVIFGENVKMPGFNVIGTFFGIGQTKLPENNFARIILMSFIIFCLIFRTAYQGNK